MVHCPSENAILLATSSDSLVAAISALELGNHSIVHIENGQEAMQYLRQNKPKLVIASETLELLSGKHIVNGMRYTSHLEDIKTVLVINGIQKDFKDADYTLQEPLEQAMLQDIMQRTLELPLIKPEELLVDETKQILIVEDSPAVTTLLEHILSREGFEVTGARSVKEAKKVLVDQKDKFNLLLLDINLQGGSGIDVLKFMKGRSTTPSIILSALQKQTSIDESLELGACDFIPKPFDPRDLLNSIRMHLA